MRTWTLTYAVQGFGGATVGFGSDGLNAITPIEAQICGNALGSAPAKTPNDEILFSTEPKAICHEATDATNRVPPGGTLTIVD